MTKTAQAARLEAIMSDVATHPVELTIRGARNFTFSTDDYKPEIEQKIAAYFGNAATVTGHHVDPAEDEDGMGGSFVYVDAA